MGDVILSVNICRKKYNKYELNLEDENGLYGIGYCSNTGNKFYFDMEDYDKIKDYTWLEHIDKKRKYSSVETRDFETDKIVKMHQIVFEKYCDHKDRNTLNNRKYNLRSSSFSENSINQKIQNNNTSGFIGVSWHRVINKWTVNISANKKQIYIGSFDNKHDAIVARLRAEREYHGEFAPQKHLFEEYGIL